MCYYKRTRYSCNHTQFTFRLRTCHVQDEHQADPEGCAPCDVKHTHPMQTVSVRHECSWCSRMMGIVNELKKSLGSIKEKVGDLEQAKALATKRLKARLDESREEDQGLNRVNARDDEIKRKVEELENATDRARQCLEKHLGKAHDDIDLDQCLIRPNGIKKNAKGSIDANSLQTRAGEMRWETSYMGENGTRLAPINEEEGEEGEDKDTDAGKILPNVRLTW